MWQGALHPVTANAPLEESPVTQSTALPELIAATATQPAPLDPKPLYSATPSRLRATPTTDLPRATLIGDSIMQGAAPMIEDVLGPNIYINAARKRKMEDVPALVKTLAREGHLGMWSSFTWQQQSV